MILLAQLSFSAESSITSRTSFNMFTWLTLKVLWVARGGLMFVVAPLAPFEVAVGSDGKPAVRPYTLVPAAPP